MFIPFFFICSFAQQQLMHYTPCEVGAIASSVRVSCKRRSKTKNGTLISFLLLFHTVKLIFIKFHVMCSHTFWLAHLISSHFFAPHFEMCALHLHLNKWDRLNNFRPSKKRVYTRILHAWLRFYGYENELTCTFSLFRNYTNFYHGSTFSICIAELSRRMHELTQKARVNCIHFVF